MGSWSGWVMIRAGSSWFLFHEIAGVLHRTGCLFCQTYRFGYVAFEVKMKFLFDTNIVIPLEPQAPPELGSRPPMAMDLVRMILESKNQLLVHPLIANDIERDAVFERKSWTKLVLTKYPMLEHHAEVTAEFEVALGGSTLPFSNDWVDNHLLLAVERDAVDYLVSEDRGIHRKAARMGIGDRVVHVTDALTILRGFFPRFAPVPPAVERLPTHRLDENDPIFDGFRLDYPGFDDWLRSAKRHNRPTWVVPGFDGKLAAVCILKHEESGEYGLSGKVLKICTFKVGDDYHGYRFGELLLKPVFRYAADNYFDRIYVTAFEKHEHLLTLFGEFGFETLPQTSRYGEQVLTRVVLPAEHAEQSNTASEFCRKFMPLRASWQAAAWIIPIQPRFEAVLFPDRQQQGSLFRGVHPFGNGIRKAYLSHANATSMAPGDLVAFYRSADEQALVSLGAVDATKRSADWGAIARFVARRTVYSEADIKQMCDDGEVLAISFRQVLHEFRPVPLAELRRHGIAVPQSTARIKPEVLQWLRNRCGM
jgi:hypothetical protein